MVVLEAITAAAAVAVWGVIGLAAIGGAGMVLSAVLHLIFGEDRGSDAEG